MSILFLSVHDFRADYIGWQVQCLRKFCIDPWRMVVVDNSLDQRVTSCAIPLFGTDTAKIVVQVPEGITNRATANEAHASALCWGWREIACRENAPFVILLDMDCVPVAPFSVEGYLRGFHVAGWGQERGRVNYLWPGLVLLDYWNLPAPETISWDCGEVDGQRVDVGGQFARYLRAHSEVKVRAIPGTSHIRRDSDTLLHLPETFRARYEDDFRMEVFARSWLHVGNATNWRHDPDELVARKEEYVRDLLTDTLSGKVTWR